MTGSWLSTAWFGNLGWSLLHFVWQGTLVAALVYPALLISRRPQLRYLLACLALVSMAAAPLMTFAYLTSRPSATTTAPTATAPARDTSNLDALGNRPAETTRVAPAIATSKAKAFTLLNRVSVRGFSWGELLPYLVMVWMVGVGLLSVRLAGGWWVSRRWQQKPGFAPAELQHKVLELSRRLGVTTPVRLLVSGRVTTPVVLGVFKSVILLPASALTGLSPAQLELVLAHELAHVKRRDYLVNLLQNLLETLLFYHPAVWWVSGVVRQEREVCCDDLVTSLGGDRLVYAQALTRLERRRAGLALGASDGALLRRVKRLLGVEVAAAPAAGWTLLLTVVAAGLVTLATLSLQAPALAQAKVTPAPTVQEAHPKSERQLWVDVKGDVTFKGGYSDVKSISDGGYLQLEERMGNRTVKFIRIVPETGSKLSYVYAEGDVSISPTREGASLTLEGDMPYSVQADKLYGGDWTSFAERTPGGAAWFRDVVQHTVRELRQRELAQHETGRTIYAWGYLDGADGFPSQQDGTYSLVNVPATFEGTLEPNMSENYRSLRREAFAPVLDSDVLQAVHFKARRYASDASVSRFVMDLLETYPDVLTPDIYKHLLYLVAEVEDDTVKAELLKALASRLNDNPNLQLRTTFVNTAMTIGDEVLQREVLTKDGPVLGTARLQRDLLSLREQEAILSEQSQTLIERARALQSGQTTGQGEVSRRRELDQVLTALDRLQDQLLTVRVLIEQVELKLLEPGGGLDLSPDTDGIVYSHPYLVPDIGGTVGQPDGFGLTCKVEVITADSRHCEVFDSE